MSYLTKKSYRFLSNERDNSITPEPIFELDEADVWNSNANGFTTTTTNNHTHTNSIDSLKKSIPTSRFGKKSMKKVDQGGGGVTIVRSLPVNIPDWSKMSSKRDSSDDDDDEEEEEDEDRSDEGNTNNNKVPPHEYLLARQMRRTQIACSFSVHEGRGRTLKGRDLSRVRNAIWEKTGFED